MRYDYDYVIVGAGMAADSAARGIRSKDPDGSIALLGQDVDPPYERPALTKSLWISSELSVDEVFLGTRSATGARVHTETRVTNVNRADRVVRTTKGDTFTFRKLLLATGGIPRQLNLPPSSNVIYFRYLTDYRRLREVAGVGRHVVVIGGGYIGTELACALAVNDTRVTFIVPDREIGSRSYPPKIRARLARAFQDHDVTVHTGRRVTALAHIDADPAAGVEVTLADDSRVVADAVVAGLGIEPDVQLARHSGLTMDLGGVVVDEHLRTSSPHIYAAGDIAVYPDKILGRRRIEHVDQAQASGAAAGRNMAGANEPYTHTPLFFSDLFDDGYEAVGTLDTRLDLVEDWAPEAENARGVVYYLHHGGLRGVLLWNVWNSADKARELLKELWPQGSVQDASELRGRIPR